MDRCQAITVDNRSFIPLRLGLTGRIFEIARPCIESCLHAEKRLTQMAAGSCGGRAALMKL